MIIVTSSFSKSSVFELFSVHTKTKNRRFQIPPVSTVCLKSSVLRRVSVDGRTNRRSKAAFSNSPGVWTLP